jgi:hypothetical protein
MRRPNSLTMTLNYSVSLTVNCARSSGYIYLRHTTSRESSITYRFLRRGNSYASAKYILQSRTYPALASSSAPVHLSFRSASIDAGV